MNFRRVYLGSMPTAKKSHPRITDRESDQQNKASSSRRKLPEIADPPYRTKLGRAKVNRDVQEIFESDLKKDRDRLVLEHLPLVKELALRIRENLPAHVDLDDLVHAGLLGLIDAATKFTTDKMVTFESCAKQRIEESILNWASRGRYKQMEQATRGSTKVLNIAPSAPKIPGKSELQLESTSSINEMTRAMLSVATKTLPEPYQKVVFLYYSNEMTMKEIGTILGVPENKVSEMHRAALEQMSLALVKRSVAS